MSDRTKSSRRTKRAITFAVIAAFALVATSAYAVPQFGVTPKTVSPDPVREGDMLTYVITMTNNNDAGDVTFTDVFDSCLDISGFNPLTDVVVSPGPATVNFAAPTLTIDFTPYAAGATQTITITGIIAPPEGDNCCNQGVIDIAGFPRPVLTTDPTTAILNDPTCRVSQAPLSGPDFAGSTKVVTPSPTTPGAAITFDIVMTNSGSADATDVLVVDDIAACIDDTAFNAATDVTAVPGPIANVTYVGRQLTVEFAAVPAAPGAGSTQTITVAGLLAGAATASCCNQAAFSSFEIVVPQRSDDPNLPGSQDPTCFAIDSVPLPNFDRSTKDVTPRTTIPGMPITYAIEVTNTGPADADNVLVTDLFLPCIDDTAFMVGTDVVVSPGPAAAIYTARTLTVSFATIPVGVTETITVTGLLAGGLNGPCCNQGQIAADGIGSIGTDDNSTPAADDPTCFLIGTTAAPDFSTSTKVVSPSGSVAPGTSLTYTVTVNNSGAGDATNVTLSDILPGCIDDSLFNSGTDVTVAPGPATAIAYNAPTRELTVDFSAMAAAEVQTITITGISSGPANPNCCNQGSIISTETPNPVLTDEPNLPGASDETCIEIVDVTPGGPDLLRNDEWNPPTIGKAEIFTGPATGPTCPTANDPAVTLDPFGLDCTPEAFPTADDDDMHEAAFATGDPDPQASALDASNGILFFYQVDLAPTVGNGVRVVKRPDAIDPTGYVIVISF